MKKKRRKDNLKRIDLQPFKALKKETCVTSDDLHPGLRREKCEHAVMFSTSDASRLIFVKHEPSTGSTQQEVLLRYIIYLHSYTDTPASEALCFWISGDESTTSVNKLYNNRLLSYSDLFFLFQQCAIFLYIFSSFLWQCHIGSLFFCIFLKGPLIHIICISNSTNKVVISAVTWEAELL